MRETSALANRPERTVSPGKLASIAPTPPLRAVARMTLATGKLRERAEELLRTLVLAQLPVGGVPLEGDFGGLQRAVEELERRLLGSIPQLASSVRAAGRLAATHGHDEYERVMNTKLPGRTVGVGNFERQALDDMRKYVTEYAAELRGALLEARAARTPVAPALEAKGWVMRVRGDQLSRSRSHQFFEETFRRWTERGGDDESVWVTRRDHKVRHSHRPLHGVVFNNKTGINGLFPGKETNCRCGSVPKSAMLDA